MYWSRIFRMQKRKGKTKKLAKQKGKVLTHLMILEVL